MNKTCLRIKMKMTLGMKMVLLNVKSLRDYFFSKRRDINGELVKKHFLVQDLEVLLKKMKKIKDAQKIKVM